LRIAGTKVALPPCGLQGHFCANAQGEMSARLCNLLIQSAKNQCINIFYWNFFGRGFRKKRLLFRYRTRKTHKPPAIPRVKTPEPVGGFLTRFTYLCGSKTK
jgi:hypothetical protein